MKNSLPYLLTIALLLTPLCGYGQNAHVLHFRFDNSEIDAGFMGNDTVLTSLDRLFRDVTRCRYIDSVTVSSFSSPEGSRPYNERLSSRRGESVKGYLLNHFPHLIPATIHLCPQGEAWEELLRLIAADPAIPEREELQMILKQVADADKRKRLLKYLNGGRAYRYMEEHLWEKLRNASVCTVWLKDDPAAKLPAELAPAPVFLPKQSGTITASRNGKINSAYIYNYVQQPAASPAPAAISASAPSASKPLFALKTNLLFDAALMPNVEVEVPFGNRWSVVGEYMFPWWLLDGGKYCLQVISGGVEGRYWFGNPGTRMERAALTGHFAGLYAGGGKYDLQWKSNGYQGEFFIAAGVSYGYALPVGRRLHLEFNLGVGLLRTGYRHYHAKGNYKTLLWQGNGKYTWFGPTKAKVSLVWLLNRKAGKGGAK